MGVVKVEVEIAKEIDDVMGLVVELIKDIKAKKGVAELAAENLQGLMNAIAGIDQVQGEIAANKKAAIQGISLRVGDLVSALI